MPRLILLRHGQSQWNLENRFTGWTDVDLSDHGRDEAREADNFGYDFLVAKGKNPWGMVMSFEKIPARANGYTCFLSIFRPISHHRITTFVHLTSKK